MASETRLGEREAPVATPHPVVEFRLGDVVRLRKRHPCGGYDWEVVRLGADIGLRCQRCGRRVLLERRALERRVKGFLARGPEAPQGTGQ